jgi:hypothetical protein
MARLAGLLKPIWLSLICRNDHADQIISEAKLSVHYVPGDHDFIEEALGNRV